MKLTPNELVFLKMLAENPEITQVQIAEQTGKSVRTIKREMSKLKEKGCIRRISGNRNGKWEALGE